MRRAFFIITIIITLSFWCLLSFAVAPVYFSGLLIKTSPTISHFTFVLSQKTYGKVKFLANPNRVVVEFANTTKHFDMQNTILNGANVKKITIEETTQGRLRFIFYVNSIVKWDIKFLSNDEDYGARLQLTMVNIKTEVVHTISRPKNKLQNFSKHNVATNKATSPGKDKIQTDIFKTLADLSELNKKPESNPQELIEKIKINKPRLIDSKKPNLFTVVIDAGHGGKDSGAIGQDGVKEKDVVLKIAKILAKKINQQPNMRAVLTRNADYFVPLRDRLKFARKGKADIFIAIHADAYFNHVANGVSVFALSQRGATSEAARWLAHRENYSELGGVELNALPDSDPILRSVLVDLAQTATIRDSIRLGNKVLDALDTISSLHHSQVERAPFVVLKSPDIPSILVETGFISNPHEEQRLNETKYQQKIAHCLWQGINLYIHQYLAMKM